MEGNSRGRIVRCVVRASALCGLLDRVIKFGKLRSHLFPQVARKKHFKLIISKTMEVGYANQYNN